MGLKTLHNVGSQISVPGEFESAFQAMADGARSFAEFRDDLANVLYLDFRAATAIQSFLEAKERRGIIPTHLLKVVKSDIQRICAEDVPTLIDTEKSSRPGATRPGPHLPPADSPADGREELATADGAADLDEPDDAQAGGQRRDKAEAAPSKSRQGKKRRQANKATDRKLATAPEKQPAGESQAGSRKSQVDTVIRELDTGTKSRPAGELSKPLIMPKLPAAGDVLAERFELVERIDGGSMSILFKARDLKAATERFVAVKFVSEALAGHGQAIRALQAEAKTGGAVDHPGIVRYEALHRERDLFFIVMEWLDGEPLSVAMDRYPGQPYFSHESRRIVRSLADALDAVHARGLVHADVKPGMSCCFPMVRSSCWTSESRGHSVRSGAILSNSTSAC